MALAVFGLSLLALSLLPWWLASMAADREAERIRTIMESLPNVQNHGTR